MGNKPSGKFSHRLAGLLFVLSAVVTGVSVQMDWFSRRWDPSLGTLQEWARGTWARHHMDVRLWATALLVLLLFCGGRSLLRFAVQRHLGVSRRENPYRGPDNWFYAVFLLTALGAFGFYAAPFVLFVLFVLGQAMLIVRLSPRMKQLARGEGTTRTPIMILFWASGFAALIYQVVWQRALLQAFGVNIESVTVIVSVFMLGLGLGSLFGGVLSKRFPDRLPQLFVVCEVVIGLFGLVSLALIEQVTRATLHSSLSVVTATTFALLCIPTAFMGATLPILVTYLHRTNRNVGQSLSLLYFVNTLGSAAASILCVNLFFLYFGLEGAARIAVLFNLGVAYFGFRFIRSGRVPVESEPSGPSGSGATGRNWRYGWVLAISFAVGFISLSMEILFVRLLSFVTGTRATVFGNLLGAYLVGIAIGSLVARSRCDRERGGLLTSIAGFLLAGAGAFYLLGPATAWLTTWVGVGAIPVVYLGAAVVALLTGAVFPMLTHYAVTRSDAVGVPVSGVYFANILGATAGPLLTGFYLLEWHSLERNILHFSLLTLALAALIAVVGHRTARVPRRWIAVTVGFVILALPGFPLLYGDLMSKLFHKREYRSRPPFDRTVHNRSGIVATFPQPNGVQTVVGGGVYDGGFNTSLLKERNINKIDCAYFIGALHPNPRRILEIGLSSGSWARVLLNYETVESMDIVEINPGYSELIRGDEENATVFDDPRVTIHVDDGRRWLLRNPDERYDIIVMNTSFYWRSQINNLVSREFAEEARRHLLPGGVLYYNATDSRDIYYTASEIYPYLVRYNSYVGVSDSPFAAEFDEKLRRLSRFSHQGEPILEWAGGRVRPAVEQLARTDTTNLKPSFQELSSVAQLITDNNLASEFKTGRKFFAPPRSWLSLFSLWYASG